MITLDDILEVVTLSGGIGRISVSLDSRSYEILDAVVRLHSETGRPVSSGLVERYLSSAPCSATIRAVMKRLEQAGYLVQPHTSAGRLPTDAGYRIHVDRLRTAWSLRRFDLPAGMLLAARQAAPAPGGQGQIKDLAHLLSLLTRNISIVVGPSLDLVSVVRLESYPRSARKVMMVLILDNGQVQTRLVDLDGEYPPQVISEAAVLLSERLAGRPLGEIRREEAVAVNLLPTPLSCCGAALAREGMRMLGDLDETQVEMDGVARMLDEPEFQDTAPLKALIRFLESPREIRTVLSRMYHGDRETFGVWIGSENPLGGLREFSVVTAEIKLESGRGLLAVLGPRRLPYQRAFQGMEILRRFRGDHPPAAAN